MHFIWSVQTSILLLYWAVFSSMFYWTVDVLLYNVLNVLCKWWARRQISLHRDNKLVLYCIALYCIVLHCITLYCIVLYLEDADRLHDQLDTCRGILHGLHDGDVILLQRVEGCQGSLHGRHSHCQPGLAVVLSHTEVKQNSEWDVIN